jgi:sugar O-acyltransferase (sialic acid O-acetyltransferase NeuD family)
MSHPLIILGTGGSAYDILDVVNAINAVTPTWEVAGFLDDDAPPGRRIMGLEVLGTLREAIRFPGHAFANAIGSEKSFRRLPEILGQTRIPADRFASLVHPLASVSSQARLGRGVTVNHGVAVGGASLIGDHVTLCPGCLVGHDSIIGDFSILAPGAIVSGFVEIGRRSYIGAGAVLRPHIVIGESALVGMGAVVVRDVQEGAVVVGNPARTVGRAATGLTEDS